MTPDARAEPAVAMGYRKGEDTRNRILQAALHSFGESGFKGATTRQIALAAGVNLPAIKYYFGGKQGLYDACALDIVERYQHRMLALVTDAHAEFRHDMTPAAARVRLKQVMRGLAAMLVEAESWSGFVMREMTERGTAFTILYDHLWAPGIALTAGLLGRACGAAAPAPEHRIRSLLLISSLSAFSASRPVSLRYLDWDDVADDRFGAIVAVIERQIDELR
jgi:AcrR family transcriptional regulator